VNNAQTELALLAREGVLTEQLAVMQRRMSGVISRNELLKSSLETCRNLLMHLTLPLPSQHSGTEIEKNDSTYMASARNQKVWTEMEAWEAVQLAEAALLEATVATADLAPLDDLIPFHVQVSQVSLI
jgi:hypothetical protein